jgi:predicted XRE-type DNA-binding protein
MPCVTNNAFEKVAQRATSSKIDLFTIDMLVNMLARAGLKVEITIQRAA